MNRFSAALALMLLSAVAAPAQEQSASTQQEVTVSRASNDGVHRWKNSNGVTNFNVEVRGKFDLTDDDKDVKNLSDNAYLEITKTVFGSRRTIIIESLGGGRVKREYYEGRTKMDWDTAGKTWLSEILPEIVRSTTIGAESRVNRFFAKGGAKAVLDEFANLEGDYVRAHYAKLLLAKDIPRNDMPKVIEQVSQNISSDYYLSTVLQSNINKMLETPESAQAFFNATKRISSDYYKSVVLKDALRKTAAAPAQIKTILQSASTISSEYYLSVVLTEVLEQPEVKDEVITELVNVSKNIPSDYYRSQVLTKALAKPGLSKASLKSVVNALGDVDSDYYKTIVINRMTEKSTMDADVQVQVVTLIDGTVDSDYYASGAMRNLLQHQKLSDESFKQLVTTAGKLGSANYASEVLREAARRDLNKGQLLDILEASKNIDSDHYLSEVLLALAPQVKGSDSSVKDAYRAAAKKIGSDTYYGRAVKAID